MSDTAFKKAEIHVLQGKRASAVYQVLFNPTDYSIERTNSFKASSIVGLSGPLLQFIHGEADLLSMELFIDDYTDRPADGKSVEDRIVEIASLLEVDAALHAPPPVRFVWGKLDFKAIIEKLTRKITLFRPDGTAARATLNVSFKEYKTLTELLVDPRRESADKSKRRVLVGLDDLWTLAGKEYGDPALWRVIAEANDIDEPRNVASGTWLIVPALEERHG
jgi:nucleoid-associated protein YgaU